MGIFTLSNSEKEKPTPQRRWDLFGRSPSAKSSASSNGSPRGSFFRRSRSPPQDASPPNTPSYSLFSHHGADRTIQEARQKVTDAEDAEKEADKALHHARVSVKAARDHVKILEKEAAEE